VLPDVRIARRVADRTDAAINPKLGARFSTAAASSSGSTPPPSPMQSTAFTDVSTWPARSFPISSHGHVVRPWVGFRPVARRGAALLRMPLADGWRSRSSGSPAGGRGCAAVTSTSRWTGSSSCSAATS
jgi:hypothetical protein